MYRRSRDIGAPQPPTNLRSMRAVLSTALVVLVLLLNLMQATATALEGQRVLVTGGGRGIGRAIALLCASEGAKHVAVIARNTEELASVVAEGGSCMLSRTADVTDEAAVDEAVKSIAAEMGGIDILVNNAGGASVKGPLHEQSVGLVVGSECRLGHDRLLGGRSARNAGARIGSYHQCLEPRGQGWIGQHGTVRREQVRS